MHEHLNVLEQRLSAVERQNRRLRLLLVVLFAVAVAPVFVSAGAQQSTAGNIIRAEQFEVVKDGKTVLRLGSTAQGGSLDIYNTTGNTVAFLTTNDHGATMKLSNLAGKNAVVFLGSNTSDVGFLFLGPGDGKSTAELVGSGTPSITLKDGQGAQTFRVP
jgi:hypothetical protein